MPFVRQELSKLPADICRSSEHNPPGHIVLEPGKHVWKCPVCGEEQTIRVGHRPELVAMGFSCANSHEFVG